MTLTDPWLPWFREREGKKYLNFVIARDGDTWWTRDLSLPLNKRGIGMSASLPDAKRSCEVSRGLIKPMRMSVSKA